MPNVLRKFTVIAYDDDTCVLEDHEGFGFPPVCVITFDDFDSCGIFSIGAAWSIDDFRSAIGSLYQQFCPGGEYGPDV